MSKKPTKPSAEYLQTLRDALEGRETALREAEKARDAWNLDSDNPDHASAYDAMLDELHADSLPDWLSHVLPSTLMKEHDQTGYNVGFSDWADGQERERERDKRQTWSDFDELCEAVEEAESERDDAQAALDDAEADAEG